MIIFLIFERDQIVDIKTKAILGVSGLEIACRKLFENLKFRKSA